MSRFERIKTWLVTLVAGAGIVPLVARTLVAGLILAVWPDVPTEALAALLAALGLGPKPSDS